MATKADLRPWVIEALTQLGGQGSVVNVCRAIWQTHESDLRESGDLFFTWQYDVRWAAKILRDEGAMATTKEKSATPWQLK